jgi:hypothetical protein
MQLRVADRVRKTVRLQHAHNRPRDPHRRSAADNPQAGWSQAGVVPQGEEITAPARPRIENTLIKALARAFRCRKLLETGAYVTVAEMADAEGINRSYVSRVLRLTLLAPEIVEGILEGRLGTELVMPNLLEPRSEFWIEQQLSKAD